MAMKKIKTTLVNANPKDQYAIYPVSYADVIFLIKQNPTDTQQTVQEKLGVIENLISQNKELINTVEKKITSTIPYKGIFPSLEILESYFIQSGITLKPGDYAIISHEDADDELYIYDVTDQKWVAKGNIVQGDIKMINGQLPDEKGNVVITIDDIDDLRNLLNSFATKEELLNAENKSMKYGLVWDEGTNYKNGDVVEHEDCIYVLVSDETALNIEPGSNNVWKLIGVTTKYVEDNGGKIDIIKINDEKVTIKNKTVNIPIPTTLSGFTNDLNFVDQEYVQLNGGKINSISVNGEKLEISEEKNVEISLPTFTILED